MSEAPVLDEKAFSVSAGWTIVKVRAYREKEIYDKLFEGQPEYYETSEAEFLTALGVELPASVRTLRFAQPGFEMVYYAYKEA